MTGTIATILMINELMINELMINELMINELIINELMINDRRNLRDHHNLQIIIPKKSETPT